MSKGLHQTYWYTAQRGLKHHIERCSACNQDMYKCLDHVVHLCPKYFEHWGNSLRHSYTYYECVLRYVICLIHDSSVTRGKVVKPLTCMKTNTDNTS